MPKTKTKPKERNRSQEAIARGNVLRAFEISREADGLIDQAADALSDRMAKALESLGTGAGRCTRTQALESLIREGAKKILGKSTSRT